MRRGRIRQREHLLDLGPDRSALDRRRDLGECVTVGFDQVRRHPDTGLRSAGEQLRRGPGRYGDHQATRLANKWAALAIGALEDGPLRFGELQRRLQGISPKVLTQTLRRLEENGFLHREIYPAVPLHVEYSLTDLGHSVSKPLAALRTWVETHLEQLTA